jgi:hypothetical protein
VRHFGSARDVGEGEIKSLEACIKAGSVDEVRVHYALPRHAVCVSLLYLFFTDDWHSGVAYWRYSK